MSNTGRCGPRAASHMPVGRRARHAVPAHGCLPSPRSLHTVSMPAALTTPCHTLIICLPGTPSTCTAPATRRRRCSALPCQPPAAPPLASPRSRRRCRCRLVPTGWRSQLPTCTATVARRRCPTRSLLVRVQGGGGRHRQPSCRRHAGVAQESGTPPVCLHTAAWPTRRCVH